MLNPNTRCFNLRPKYECDITCALPDIKKGEKDCISCHMPKIISKTMFAKNTIANDTVNVEVVSHRIGIYKTN